MTRGVFAGLATLDVVHRVDGPPPPGRKVTARSQVVGPGGPAAGAALTFAALGGAATLVTALGPGPVGRLIRGQLEAHGVTVLDVDPDGDREPPVSAVAVETGSGERTVVSLDAVATQVEVPPGLPALIRGADVVLADGHYPPIGIAAAELAVRSGVPVVIDAGRFKPAMPRLIACAGDLVCSNDFRLPGRPDQAATLRALAGSGPARVVVTRGAGPVSWREGGRSGEVLVPPIEVTDTLGAGDAFHGAYAFYLAATPGLRLEARIALSIGVATERCRAGGPQEWLSRAARWGLRAR